MLTGPGYGLPLTRRYLAGRRYSCDYTANNTAKLGHEVVS
jgi:hypothetical protein